VLSWQKVNEMIDSLLRFTSVHLGGPRSMLELVLISLVVFILVLVLAQAY
jgi:hypothetical protein